MESWQGDERRAPEGVLIAVMNHVSERIEEVEKRHEERYSNLEEKIISLTNSVNSWADKEPLAIIEKCEKMIDEMIPTHPENPDASLHEKRKEHRQAHSKWIADVTYEMAKWARIREKVYEWAVISGIGLICLAVWKLLLEGPK